MSGGFTALATILGGFISGITGIIVFLFKDRIENKREKDEWYSDIIKQSDQISNIYNRYEQEYCGKLVRNISGRMHSNFQRHLESAPDMASDEVLDLLEEISVKCHDISNTRVHSYEGGDRDGEVHIQNRHEEELPRVVEFCEKLARKCEDERDSIERF